MIDWSLGGYGTYVWPAYAVTFVVLIGLSLTAALHYRKVLRLHRKTVGQAYES